MSNAFNRDERERLQKYIVEKFANNNISLAERKEAPDSLEVLLSGEFLGLIYKDKDEGEISYNFNMAILDFDLPESA